MGDAATKEDVRTILQEEHRKLRKDVIEPIQKSQTVLLLEVYGETGQNGMKGRVNALWRVFVWGSGITGTVLAAGLIWFLGFTGGA